MAKDINMKNISTTISNNCWKALKVISIQQEIPLIEVARNTLEKAMGTRSKSEVKEEVI
jgi:hypothetical protein